jgi:hypothetical protein
MWTSGKFARFPNGDEHAKDPGMTSSDIKPELLPFDEIVRGVLKSVPQLVRILHCHGRLRDH